jgi:hypothetical protein
VAELFDVSGGGAGTRLRGWLSLEGQAGFTMGRALMGARGGGSTTRRWWQSQFAVHWRMGEILLLAGRCWRGLLLAGRCWVGQSLLGGGWAGEVLLQPRWAALGSAVALFFFFW